MYIVVVVLSHSKYCAFLLPLITLITELNLHQLVNFALLLLFGIFVCKDVCDYLHICICIIICALYSHAYGEDECR